MYGINEFRLISYHQATITGKSKQGVSPKNGQRWRQKNKNKENGKKRGKTKSLK